MCVARRISVSADGRSVVNKPRGAGPSRDKPRIANHGERTGSPVRPPWELTGLRLEQGNGFRVPAQESPRMSGYETCLFVASGCSPLYLGAIGCS